MNQLSKGSCCHCEKLLRLDDQIYCHDNCQNLLQYVITNGLINLQLHKKCYIKLYEQQKTSGNDADKEQQMNVTLTVVDTYVQTEQCFDNIITSSPMDMSISCVTSETSASAAFSLTTSNSLVNSNSIELPYYRLSKSNQSCSICKINFSKKKRKSTEIHKEIRAECLINHRIFIPEKSKCCTTHIWDDSLQEEDIEIIKKSKAMLCSIEQYELIEIFSLMKTKLQSLKSKLDNLEKKPILSLNIDSVFNASN